MKYLKYKLVFIIALLFIGFLLFAAFRPIDVIPADTVGVKFVSAFVVQDFLNQEVSLTDEQSNKILSEIQSSKMRFTHIEKHFGSASNKISLMFAYPKDASYYSVVINLSDNPLEESYCLINDKTYIIIGEMDLYERIDGIIGALSN